MSLFRRFQAPIVALLLVLLASPAVVAIDVDPVFGPPGSEPLYIRLSVIRREVSSHAVGRRVCGSPAWRRGALIDCRPDAERV